MILSFDTSSLAMLDEVTQDSAPGKQNPGLTVVVARPGTRGRLAMTELTDVFSKAVVTSFYENLSGQPSGKVTLSLR
jgi:hypothetical protein